MVIILNKGGLNFPWQCPLYTNSGKNVFFVAVAGKARERKRTSLTYKHSKIKTESEERIKGR